MGGARENPTSRYRAHPISLLSLGFSRFLHAGSLLASFQVPPGILWPYAAILVLTGIFE